MLKSTCPACKKVLKGYKWTKTKSNKNWLMNGEGDWHSCEKVESKSKSKYINLFEKETSHPRYFSCGKCGNNCKEYGFFEYYCKSCDMYPQVTNRRMDDMGAGPTDPSVGTVMTTNHEDLVMNFIFKKFTSQGLHVSNWMQMNEDGTIKAGYKLYDETKKWFEEGGKELIKELNSLTIETKKVRKHNLYNV